MYEQISDIKGKDILYLRIGLGLSDGEKEEIGRLLERQARDSEGTKSTAIH